jgi:cell wall-associated NlpC family hydrolase
MLYRLLIAIVAISGIISCSNENVLTEDKIIQSIDSLKSVSGFDKNEDVFYWNLDTLENNEVVVTYKTTDLILAEKAVELAEGYNLKTKIVSLPAGDNALVPFAVVNTSVANTRARTSRASSMATQVLMGMQLEIIDNEGKWYRVRTPQGYIAWMVKTSFEFLTKTEAENLKKQPKVMVTTPTTFAYNVENKSQIVSDLVYGNVVVLEELGKTWTKVILPGDRKAIVKTNDITELSKWQESAKFDKDKLLEAAYQHLGQPYLWGGNSFKGNDCSGFSAAVYYSLGILLPRDAYQQQKQGDHVDYIIGEKDGFKNLEIGDLIFFGGSRVTHVAVWIGNNEYIHNSSSYGRVYISSVDKDAENYNQSLVDIILDVRRINGSNNIDKTIDLKNSSIW